MNESLLTTKVFPVFLLAVLLAACSPQESFSPPGSSSQLDVFASTQSATFVPNPGIADAAVLFRTLGAAGTLFFEQQQVVFHLPAPIEAHKWFSHLMGTSPSDPEKPTQPSSVCLQFVGANPYTQVVGQEQLPGIVNYFLGDDPAKWQTDVPTFNSLAYEGLYPGIDLIYNRDPGMLKGTFLVASGANPDVIRWRYEGVSRVELSKRELLIGADEGGKNPLFVERSPVAWQTVDGKCTAVDAHYVVHADSSIGFVLGTYDVTQPLVIDPTLDYGTHWGSAGCDGAYDLALDSNNNVYITGATNSPVYPPAIPRCSQTKYFDAYVTKLDPSKKRAKQHIYTTYIGGNNYDMTYGIGVDTAGNVYAAGFTQSNNIPATRKAYQKKFNGGGTDGMVFQLDSTGVLQYLSYLGGKGFEELIHMTIGSDPNAKDTDESMRVADKKKKYPLVYVTGFTDSSDFPTTPDAYERTTPDAHESTRVQRDVFVSIFDLSKKKKASLAYSTRYGGSGYDEGYAISVANDIIYFAGTTTSKDLPLKNPVQTTFRGGGWGDVFAAVLDPSQSPADQLLFSTYLGGSKNDIPGGVATYPGGSQNEVPGGVAPSSTEYMYVAGTTLSSNFPTTGVSPSFGGNADAFLTKLDVTAPTSLVYSRFVGGSGRDGIRGVVVDSEDNAYVAGGTGSKNFQTVDPLQATFKGGAALNSDSWTLTTWNAVDALIAKFDPTGAMTFGTFWGGTGADGAGGIRIGTDGKVYVAGGTRSKKIKPKNAFQKKNAGQYDAFVVGIGKLAASPPIPVKSSSSKEKNKN